MLPTEKMYFRRRSATLLSQGPPASVNASKFLINFSQSESLERTAFSFRHGLSCAGGQNN